MSDDPVITFVAIHAAAKLLGVSADTLRRWDAEQRFLPDRRTAGGWRLYNRDRLIRERFMRGLPTKNAKNP